jgi:hypothetical protein
MFSSFKKLGKTCVGYGKTIWGDMTEEVIEDTDWDTKASDAMRTLQLNHNDLKLVNQFKGKNKQEVACELLNLSPKEAKVVINFSSLSVAEKIKKIADTPEHFGKFFNLAHAHYLAKSKSNRNSWKKKPWKEHAGKALAILDRIVKEDEFKLTDLYEVTVRLYYLAKFKLMGNMN